MLTSSARYTCEFGNVDQFPQLIRSERLCLSFHHQFIEALLPLGSNARVDLQQQHGFLFIQVKRATLGAERHNLSYESIQSRSDSRSTERRSCSVETSMGMVVIDLPFVRGKRRMADSTTCNTLAWAADMPHNRYG